jgi:hypothetical protein
MRTGKVDRQRPGKPVSRVKTSLLTLTTIALQWEPRKMLPHSEKEPSLEEGSGSPSSCEPPPGPEYAEAPIVLFILPQWEISNSLHSADFASFAFS